MNITIALTVLAAALISTAAPAQTILTGDRIDGVAVIDRLDTADLPPASLSRFYFRAADQAGGQGWYVPVLVAKGREPGKRLLLTAGIHGDELNGIAIIQDLVPGLDLEALKGAVIAVPGLNQPGMLHDTREFTPDAYAGGVNLNRTMPGDAHGDSIGAIYAGRLWSRLLSINADAAIDMHTQSRGTAYPVYVFAETAAARKLAQALRPDVIKYDPGVKGAIETTMNAAGIPAVTLELGSADRFEPDKIARGIRGLRNVMIELGMLEGQEDRSGPEPYIGNKSVDVFAPRGGVARILTPLGTMVKAGQPVATISDPFGRVVHTATASLDGRVTSVATGPLRDAGSLLVRILGWSDDPKCKEKGCE